MRNRTLKLGLVAVTALSAAAPLVATQAAYADYAPTNKDIVGVGSDTLQYMLDFMADGDAYGTNGYNAAGNKNKLVNIDATADQTARLAFGADGNNGTGNGIASPGKCAPTTGGTPGTGNSAPGASAEPCVLNPTVVLRAGQQAVQRPNGSGAGKTALSNDIAQGTDTVNFARASAAQVYSSTIGTCGTTNNPCVDSIILGSEDVPMIAAVAGATNAVPLSTNQLKGIYTANTTGTNAFGGTGCVTWNEVGGTSHDPIIPIIPQSGSGTRSFFLTEITGSSSTSPGSCVQVGEENDPTAIATAATPADAIEPMSHGRLNLYLGKNGQGADEGIGGYFLDPTCPYASTVSGCTTTLNGSTVPAYLAPAVQVLTGATSDSSTAFDPSRNLYMYFRDSDINSTTGFQPGGTQNWLRALFYNPCQTGQTGCVTKTDPEGNSVQYGPGGAPYIDTSAGYNAILDAGVTPVDPVGTIVLGGQKS